MANSEIRGGNGSGDDGFSWPAFEVMEKAVLNNLPDPVDVPPPPETLTRPQQEMILAERQKIRLIFLCLIAVCGLLVLGTIIAIINATHLILDHIQSGT